MIIRQQAIIRFSFSALLLLWGGVFSQHSQAIDAASLTIDNDLFVNRDNGYTNGIHAAWYYIGREDGTGKGRKIFEPSWLTWPMHWSLPNQPGRVSISAYSLGQSIFTPDNILVDNPDPNDIPYAGMLLLNNMYIKSYGNYADMVATTVGVVGPASGAEGAQKFIHQLTGSDEPKGWSYQLENELIFRFSRARMWRNWVSVDGRYDLITGAELGIGTLESSLNAGISIRVGRGLSKSYLTAALSPSRTSNYVAINNGWFAYATISAHAIANNIIMDGNTFTDSRSSGNDDTQLGFATGIAYSWGGVSVTFAVVDLDFVDKNLSRVTRFGTITVAWMY